MTIKQSTLSMLSGSVLAMATTVSSASFAATAPPGTDIFMASLSKSVEGYYQASKFSQVTERKGYDNQPYFLPSGEGIFYTAMLATGDGTYQSDSFEYQFASKKHVNLTNTKTSEYSPILMNSGTHFSTIVEREGEQQFWAQAYGSKNKAYRINNAEPVGYHAWGKNDDLVMFVLGKPHTLQYQQSSHAEPRVVAKNIGRSLRYVASRNAFSFSYQKSDNTWWLAEYLPNDDKVVDLVPLIEGSGYYTWLDDFRAITSVGTEIYMWRLKAGVKATVAHWMPWLDVSKTCPTKVSRLAVNNQSSRLAFVCNEGK